MKTITIDGSSILPVPGRNMNGIARTTYELINAFSKLDTPFKIKLFSQRLRGERLDKYNFGFSTCHLPLPRWNAVEKLTKSLPVIESICQSDLYHVPRNYAPYHRLDKTLITIHDVMFFSFPEKQFLKNNLKKKVPPVARKCKAIITCSENSKKDIIKFLGISPEKIHVIYWGIDHSLFKPTIDLQSVKSKLSRKFGIKNKYFFSVSCDVGRKNTPKLLDEYLGFAETSPENDLVLVWNNIPESIEKKIHSSPYSKRVHIVKSISDEDLRDFYRCATAMVFPSLYEGFGLPVLEAMACGTAVVTTPFSSLPEVGGDAAYYIDPNEENAIYNALMRFENSDIDRDAMIRKGLNHAKKFTWEECAKETMAVYARILEI